MPKPSRWGVAKAQITVKCPQWIYDAVEDLYRKHDFPTVSMTALELLAEAVIERGYPEPEFDPRPFKKERFKVGGKPTKGR